MAKKREIRHASDPLEEKIEEVFQKYDRARPLRLSALFGESRREILSAIPIAPPVGYVQQPSLAERIRSMVRSEHLRAAAEGAGFETFEESEDFEVGEDYDPKSPYEVDASDGVPLGPPAKSSAAPSKAAEAPGGGGSAATKESAPVSPPSPVATPPKPSA